MITIKSNASSAPQPEQKRGAGVPLQTLNREP